jgi:hypothetical protein
MISIHRCPGSWQDMGGQGAIGHRFPRLKAPENTITDPEFRQVAQRARAVCQPIWQPPSGAQAGRGTWVRQIIQRITGVFSGKS